jgi:enolase
MDPYIITHIEAGEILDSRGNPTIITTVVLGGGARAAAAVPSGASTGTYEAHELRDNNPKRYNGLGVLKACSHVNVTIAQELVGEDAQNQERIDKRMLRIDGTSDKSKLGANAILSVSLAVARAVSVARGIPLYRSLQESFSLERGSKLPIPIMNVINGGSHASNNISIQEFQFIPKKGTSVQEHIELGSELFHALGDELEKHNLDTDVGDEGGYGPHISSIDEVFHVLGSVILDNGLTPGIDVSLGIDPAASEFYDAKKQEYVLSPPEQHITAQQLSKQYMHWIEKFQLASIEDPFFEEAWEDWAQFTRNTQSKGILVIGDDLLTTNVERLNKGIKQQAINAILIKPNQIGSLTETMQTIQLAQENNLSIVISHRSGETNDTFISDLAVAVGAEYLKAGAPSRGERVAKYNRLLEIEKEFGNL